MRSILAASDAEVPLVEFRNVSAHYGGALAVSDISLEVPKGEVVSIVGPNGAGKTTLLRIMSGVLSASKGEFYLDGIVLRSPTADVLVRKGIAHSPEGRRIFPYMSVRDNLLMGAFTVRDKSVIAERLAAVFRMFPILQQRASQEGRSLSGGQQQMLAIGRAYMSGPRLLLLDEPTLGLAPKIVREVGEIVRAMRATTTIVLVEQNAELALELADRVHVVAHGHLIASGPSAEIRASSVIREAYLGT